MRSNERYVQTKPPKMGSFAQVSGCYDKKTGELVAVKKLRKDHQNNADSIHRFRREMALLKELAPHPNIVPVLDKYEGDEGDWYVMPFADFSLGEYFEKNNSKLTLQNRTELFDGILAAITRSHELNILHRDLAPTNILLYSREDGGLEVTVADFGLGRNLTSSSAFTRTAQDGYGHDYYTAPEQYDGLKQASYHSDIYSLGKLLSFICTGRIPRDYQPCDFSVVIRKATEYLPEDRYPDIRSFSQAYEQIKTFLNKEEELDAEERVMGYADGSIQIDWHDFHKFAVAGEFENHVYHDYIALIVSVLRSDELVREYFSAVRGAILDFVTVYVDRVKKCTGTLGWPFVETENLGRVLDRVYRAVPSERVRIECLKELWRLGYDSDRWAIQRVVENIFTGGLLPTAHEMEVVDIIRTSNVELNKEQLHKLLGASVPKFIRQALKEKARPAS